MQINRGLWLYEKNYGFSSLVFCKILHCWDESNMLVQDQIWEEGKLRYGIEYMEKEYGKYYLEILEFHKCYLYVEFEWERLGIKNGEWKNVPDKLQGIKMYKDSINLLGFFAGVITLYNYGIWVKEFSFSYDVVHSVNEKDEEEYKKKI